MIFTMNKNRISYASLTFDTRPQIMRSGVQKYNKCMPVCQQRVNASLQCRYFRQPTQYGRQETYDFSQHFRDMIGNFTALKVQVFGAGKLSTADS